MSNPFDQQKPIAGVKHIIAVSSGKGGVGKSTVSSHLALAMARRGHKVGLLDTDIYGPSIPNMLGVPRKAPEVNSANKLLPIEKHGLKLMSMGFLVEEHSALIWRGPMLFKAIGQFLRDVDWGELDYMILDLPPGTGDVQLTICQKVPVTGAVVVSTPQNISMIDVTRALDMFKKLNVPVIGLVENMSHFLSPSGEKLEMFPKGELDSYLLKNDIPKLGEIPFIPKTAEGCESGNPIVISSPDSSEAQVFYELADKLISKYP